MSDDVNLSRVSVLNEIVANPGSFTPCKNVVKEDLKDKSQLHACLENPTPENTQWFAHQDALKSALNQMNPEHLAALQQQCSNSANKMQGRSFEVDICDALNASPNVSPTQSTGTVLSL